MMMACTPANTRKSTAIRMYMMPIFLWSTVVSQSCNTAVKGLVAVSGCFSTMAIPILGYGMARRLARVAGCGSCFRLRASARNRKRLNRRPVVASALLGKQRQLRDVKAVRADVVVEQVEPAVLAHTRVQPRHLVVPDAGQ